MDRTIIDQGMIRATRQGLNDWAKERTAPWIGAMEATLFTGWIYDHLLPHAKELKVAHPEMLKEIRHQKRKMTQQMQRKWRTCFGAIFCRNVIWHLKNIVTCGGFSVTETFWSEKL